MAIPMWPLSLPQAPLNASYAETIASTLVRSEMDIGPAKVRRKQSKPVNSLQVSYILTSSQKTALDEFITNSLYGGARAFNWAQNTSTYLEVRLVPNGDGLYSYNRNSNKWAVTLILEVLP